MVIQPDGMVQHAGNSPCRALNVMGAGVEGQNIGNIHIALAGTDKFTSEAWESLRYQVEAIWHLYDIKPYEVRGHRQYNPDKECPGFEIQRFTHWFNTGSLDAIRPHILPKE